MNSPAIFWPQLAHHEKRRFIGDRGDMLAYVSTTSPGFCHPQRQFKSARERLDPTCHRSAQSDFALMNESGFVSHRLKRIAPRSERASIPAVLKSRQDHKNNGRDGRNAAA